MPDKQVLLNNNKIRLFKQDKLFDINLKITNMKQTKFINKLCYQTFEKK